MPKPYGPRKRRPGKLEPYVGYLETALASRPEVRATVLFEEVAAKGYGGQYETVKRWVRLRRREENARRRACVRFESLPGIEGQLDWKGPVRGLLRLLFALAGWINRQQQAAIDYLREENRVLREQLGGQRLPDGVEGFLLG